MTTNIKLQAYPLDTRKELAEQLSEANKNKLNTKVLANLGPKATAALAEYKAERQLLVKVGQDSLIDYLKFLMAEGINYFEFITDAVHQEVGGYDLEQRVSDLLGKHNGDLWHSCRGPLVGPYYYLSHSW
ncbi:hypothetical protein LPB140_03215 [Sphingorhabdus lutea]|uniref:Uncharacterized protein n=1 Tax=Sphingorhabdus lutea TaxID=1913578 RepID=A0A1L3JA33_9SPHN|nr:hypothetical protein [Sphingorhabdus lutea]APG61992.1 hypothetical protein LPB140_03215 [Sphingorhabdus lutea]